MVVDCSIALSLETAMQGVAVIVLREVVGFFADCICTVCDTVCIWSYDCSKETFSWIIDIVLDIVISEYDIFIFSVFIRLMSSELKITDIRFYIFVQLILLMHG